MFFDWLVVGHVMPMNPASSMRGPRHSVRKGKTPVLAAEEARALLDAIDMTTLSGLRGRVLVELMVYSFARVGTAIGMRVEDVYVQGRRTWIRLNEEGGKVHEMPCRHNLDEYLHAYIGQEQLVDGKGWLFRSAIGRAGQLSKNPMRQVDVYRMIARRALNAKAGPRSVVTRSGPRASPSTCAMAENWKLRSRWSTMRAPGRRGSLTEGRTRFRSTKSSGSSFSRCGT